MLLKKRSQGSTGGSTVDKHSHVQDLPMNRCVDDRNVPIDFRAVFKGADVGGVDGKDVSQVPGSKSVTNYKPGGKQTAEQKVSGSEW